MVGFRVRRSTAGDWAAYRDLRLRMLAESPEAYGSSLAREAAFAEDEWRRRTTSPLLFLAYAADGRLAGTCAGLTETAGEVMVVAMYVDPADRGRGCAEALLDAVVAAAGAAGARRLVLHVNRGNVAATRCYLRYGFTRTGRSWPMERRPERTEEELALDLMRDGDG